MFLFNWGKAGRVTQKSVKGDLAGEVVLAVKMRGVNCRCCCQEMEHRWNHTRTSSRVFGRRTVIIQDISILLSV